MAQASFHFDGNSLDDLAHDLRRAASAFRRETDEALLRIGAELMESAKQIAEQHSKRVAETIRMRAIPGMVIVTVGEEDMPIAALWELGNVGQHDTAKVQGVTFRHPVFGNRDVWVTQRRFPMLRPAQQALRKEITRQMNEAYDRVLEPHRLKPSEV